MQRSLGTFANRRTDMHRSSSLGAVVACPYNLWSMGPSSSLQMTVPGGSTHHAEIGTYLVWAQTPYFLATSDGLFFPFVPLISAPSNPTNRVGQPAPIATDLKASVERSSRTPVGNDGFAAAERSLARGNAGAHPAGASRGRDAQGQNQAEKG